MSTDCILYLYKNSDVLRQFIWLRHGLSFSDFQIITFVCPSYASRLIIKALEHCSLPIVIQ